MRFLPSLFEPSAAPTLWRGPWPVRARLHQARQVLLSGRALLLFAASACLLGPVWAGPPEATGAPARTITEWLTRMHEASRHRAYMGTLVVSAGSNMSASRVWHVCDGVHQMERVETLTGEPRTTIRRDNEVITFIPESKTAWTETRESLGLFPELLRTPSNAIPDFYSARELKSERVAGHKADVVEIVPKDEWRFGYRIWSEKKTGLVVKLQTLGSRGEVLEQLAYSELQLDAPVRMNKLNQLMNNTQGYAVHKPVLKKTTADAEGWRLKDPVPGFLSMSCQIRGGGDATQGSPMQWVFSDGLASVSLFVEPFDAQRHTEERMGSMGATQSVTRRIGDFWLTALGEVPGATLQRFARMLERSR